MYVWSVAGDAWSEIRSSAWGFEDHDGWYMISMDEYSWEVW